MIDFNEKLKNADYITDEQKVILCKVFYSAINKENVVYPDFITVLLELNETIESLRYELYSTDPGDY